MNLIILLNINKLIIYFYKNLSYKWLTTKLTQIIIIIWNEI